MTPKIYGQSWRIGQSLAALPFVVSLVLCAALTALAAGLLPLQSPDLVTQLLIAASVGLAVLVNQVVVLVAKSVTDFYVLLGSLILAAGASACAVLAMWLLSLVVGKAVGLGLAGIAFVVALHGLGLIALAMPLPRGSKERVAFVGSGLNILGGFVGAAFVAAVDAGLKLLGA